MSPARGLAYEMTPVWSTTKMASLSACTNAPSRRCPCRTPAARAPAARCQSRSATSANITEQSATELRMQSTRNRFAGSMSAECSSPMRARRHAIAMIDSAKSAPISSAP